MVNNKLNIIFVSIFLFNSQFGLLFQSRDISSNIFKKKLKF